MNIDRMPMVEWAAWWDVTIRRWEDEGLPKMDFMASMRHFGLDPLLCIFANSEEPGLPAPEYHGGPVIGEKRSYDDILKYMYTDKQLDNVVKQCKAYKPMHDDGEIILRLWLDGFFWNPRKLFGIAPHMYAFYDEPELMHRMNDDLARFSLRVLDAVCSVLKPDMVGYAEDMSYNHGPMLSKALFDEFLLPYYNMVNPEIQKRGIKVLIDSDGDITTMIPWMREAGIEGVYPLERQAGVDLNFIRRENPDFLMLGGYDKMVMSRGEDAMRTEFERLLPVMKSGGYIPSVDHQTPPGVSYENYNTYMRLFREYAERAVTK